ncbi:MAG: alanine--tRNA ligase [Peptoniphilaceae bacterium]|nr:alanine--tRNA ligase [Peptoniphilaceae bacterium]MDY4196903.1 alanine--tRNA ligase [Peptoniphilaceae bacterium]MDY5841697.1 alanine--tRNA ligase [Peptoniphilaceae bacterium]MDY6146140.1 alanine--tRNA ligase [Peptoniphilaceae bacterium]
MKHLGLNEARKEFLDFFESKGHIRLKSYSLVPKGDKSLLLINAGMAPLKAYFLGEKKMAKNRATSSQRCLRTADIDNVGKTDRHATYFEMLGNFSFGDYFKKEAIHWAYEFLTEKIGLEKDKLWITVYQDDDTAYDIWTQEVGIAEDHMMRLGKEDNFWELEQGPCGPCSEIHYDRGPEFGEGSCPTDNSDRFMEIWNLVFTQFNRQADGSYLPIDHPNIDTGMGLERLALVCENKRNIFELEEFLPLRNRIGELSGKTYGQSEKTDESFRVIIDHTKAMTFLALDGVVPSNEGRGYILRRLIRRAYRHGKLLGIEGEFLTKTIREIIPVYLGEYPELESSLERIFKVVVREEESFQQTIDQGLLMLKELLDQTVSEKQSTLSGSDVFRLYDTYGFPLDLTKEIASERNIQVDEAAFREKMEQQRIQSRERRAGGAAWDDAVKLDLSGVAATDFRGYEVLQCRGKIVAIFHGKNRVEEIAAGEEGIAVLDQTPFYAESGGQISDFGIMHSDGCDASVQYVSKDKDGIFFHHVSVEDGSLHVGDCVELTVDADHRNDVRRNHSATHLLNRALREVLGEHVHQAGSYVGPDRLRFDFTHYEAMTQEQVKAVEEIVNRAIFDSYPVTTEVLPLQEAMAQGAIGLFEDKYRDVVRVVSMGDFSKELCGGTHVENTSQIQMLRILSEQGVSSGVRRMEAITGRACYRLDLAYEHQLNEEAELLKAANDQILSRTEQLIEENRTLKKEIESFQTKMAHELSQKLEQEVTEIAGIPVLKQNLPGKSMEELKEISDALKDGKNRYIIVLSSAVEGKVFWVVAMDAQSNAEGLKAGDLVRSLAQITGGNGGGRPNFATAGGKNPSKIEEALATVEEWVTIHAR